MKLNTHELKTAISSVIHVAEKKTTLPYVNCLRLSARGGRLSIQANNFDAFADVRIDCDGDFPPFWVNAGMLSVAVSASHDETSIECDGKKATIKCGSTCNLSVLEESAEAPKPPTEKALPIGCNAKDLADAIKGVAWAGVDGLAAKPLAEAVWVKTDSKLLRSACMDGVSAAAFSRASICGESEFMFPFKYADLLCRALGESGSMFIGDNWVRAQSDSLSVSVKRMEGQYWPVDMLLNMPTVEVGKIETLQLRNSLDTCKRLTTGLEPFCNVNIEFSEKGLWVAYSGKDNQYEKMLEGKFGQAKATMPSERLSMALKNIGEIAKVGIGEKFMRLDCEDLTAAVAVIK